MNGTTPKLPFLRPRSSEEKITRNQLYSQLESDDEDEVLSNPSDRDDLSEDDELPENVDDMDFATLNKLAQQAAERSEKEKDDTIAIKEQLPKAEITKEPEVVDDFIRNFLVKHSMQKTLEAFQNEWYELEQKGELQHIGTVPDVYVQNVNAEHEISRLSAQCEDAKVLAKRATEKLDIIMKERDHHKIHHQRVIQEKKILVKELNRLKQQCDKYDPVIDQLRYKYEKALKEKALNRIERDKLLARISALEITVRGFETEKDSKMGTDKPTRATPPKSNNGTLIAKLPLEDRVNPYQSMNKKAIDIESMSLGEVYEGHTMAVSSIAIHPLKPVAATASDDTTWKMWALPSGKIIMSGEGHRDWVSGIAFHPKGTHLSTASGDGSIKIWDFLNSRCSATLTDHSMAVWNVEFHDTGEFLISSSMDQTARLWDLFTGKCRSTIRGHLDSVNHATFVPFTNTVVTCSADKTVSIWDLRVDTNSLNITTLYGHNNACNHVVIDQKGTTAASSDCDGLVILWDLRTMTERKRFDAGPHPANKMAFDPSGEVLAVSSDDSLLKLFNLNPKSEGLQQRELKGHKDGVLAVAFDPESKYMLSCSSDSTVCMWH